MMKHPIKEDLVDSKLENFCEMTQDQRNTFLIQEFEHLMSEINCPDEYIMELSDQRNNARGLCYRESFLQKKKEFSVDLQRAILERRFEIFLNVTLFREIIQIIGTHNPSKLWESV